MDETASTSTFYVPFLAGGGGAAKARSPRPPPRTRILRRVLYSGLAICTGVAFLLIFYSRDASWQASPDRRATVAAVGGAPGGDSDDSLGMLEDSVGESFGRFTVAFGKKYDSDEEKRHRMAVYRRNLMFINMHNRMNATYTLAMNAFGDMTAEEFSKGYANMKRSSAKDSQKKRVMALDLLKVDPKTLPKEVDWRKKGCVTEVKDQQHCGSCWAFSTTGAMEGAVCAKTGRLPDLSEQQLVDCAGPEGNFGCNGGEADWAFQYVIDNGGLCQETDYPYKAKPSHRCKARDCKNTAEITQFKDVPPHSAHALRAALALHGPVSVAIEADEAYFQFYHRGVFSGVCGIELDHAVLLVGYGTDKETGEDYFILKNSWGASWGEEGYMKIGTKNPERMYKRDGECGLYSSPSFAQA